MTSAANKILFWQVWQVFSRVTASVVHDLADFVSRAPEFVSAVFKPGFGFLARRL